MNRIGFDSEKYLSMQSAKIEERLRDFGGKLYLEFGGKLFDDFHASRVLPGFAPDNKIKMLEKLKDRAEIVIVISAQDIAANKVRADLGITYDADVLRLIDIFRSYGLYVGSVVLSKFSEDNEAAKQFRNRLEHLGLRVYRHYPIKGTAKTNTLRPPATWWWSPPPVPAAAKWQPASRNSTMTTGGASARDMPNTKRFPSGICPLCTR